MMMMRTRSMVMMMMIKLTTIVLHIFNSQSNGQEASFFEISLTGANASQSETWQTSFASRAIDGDPSTWSVAASQLIPGAVGWWRVDMGSIYYVSGITIVSSTDFYNSMYLQTFSILVVSDSNVENLCFLYNDTISIPPGSSRTFICSGGPIPGRYVIIRRNIGSQFRQDGLALAEVNIYGNNMTTVVSQAPTSPGSVLDKNVDSSYEVSLSNLPAFQSGTWGTSGPDMAIDGNNSTFSVACINCDKTLSAGPGWWMVDLQRETAVVRVVLVASPDPYNAQYLQDIDIFLSSSNSSELRDGRLCFSFSNNSKIDVGSTLIFVCTVQPTWGRYLVVKRRSNASFRPDAIAIADVKVFVSGSVAPAASTSDSTTVNKEKNSASDESNRVIQTSNAIQSATWQERNATLAVDGDPLTWSVTDTSVDPRYQGQLAWWQIDLEANYYVSGVSITSSTDYTNSQYLTEFSIDVLPRSMEVTGSLADSIQCLHYKGDITMGTTVNCTCNSPSYGRYVVIRRTDVNGYRPEVLSLAEVQVFHN